LCGDGGAYPRRGNYRAAGADFTIFYPLRLSHYSLLRLALLCCYSAPPAVPYRLLPDAPAGEHRHSGLFCISAVLLEHHFLRGVLALRATEHLRHLIHCRHPAMHMPSSPGVAHFLLLRAGFTTRMWDSPFTARRDAQFAWPALLVLGAFVTFCITLVLPVSAIRLERRNRAAGGGHLAALQNGVGAAEDGGCAMLSAYHTPLRRAL